VQSCPCPKNLAPYIAIVVNDAKATLNSVYRGQDAEMLLNKHGKHSQRQLFDGFERGLPGFLPANPPGFSTHEQKSDGAAYPSVPRGGDLAWWQIGFDVDDQDVDRVIAQAASHKWQLWRPYSSGSEKHHLNWKVQPRPTPMTFARIIRLRATLPRS
jgi:hypothetical protein